MSGYTGGMIVVTGTKRSGTSLWMQILVAAGLPYVGERFPGPWEHSIGGANSEGFYESRFRQGIFYATNPDPKTGEYLHPDAAKGRAVKVFVPGLVRTDIAYVERVVATMRHWRDYGPSLRRLYAMEDAYLLANPAKGRTGEETQARAAATRSPLPAPVEWFFENYELIRDFATRRYPINFCTFEHLLEQPGEAVPKVLRWIGTGDFEAAVKAVEPRLRTQAGSTADEEGLAPRHVRVFDELWASIHETQSLPSGLLQELNEVNRELVEEYGTLSKDRDRDEEWVGDEE